MHNDMHEKVIQINQPSKSYNQYSFSFSSCGRPWRCIGNAFHVERKLLSKESSMTKDAKMLSNRFTFFF